MREYRFYSFPLRGGRLGWGWFSVTHVSDLVNVTYARVVQDEGIFHIAVDDQAIHFVNPSELGMLLP
ncbi:MAG: hypothetical protein BMS9Abin36_1460 [Gammaproteobacteria bacterium]|nr:MAG: hypothetical protein BMS9Abin36_1460 [Gammaproteobacteria bacterium]